MRLVDADKYCDFLNTYPLEKAQNNFMSFYREALQNTFEFEVKAIPVEWLLDKEKEIFSKSEYHRRDWQLIEAIDKIIEEWGKENETGRRR